MSTALTELPASRLREYYELCKPRVVMLIVFTAIVGMFLATPGMVPLPVLLYGTLGIGGMAASAAAINQLLDRHVLFDVVPDDRLTAARRARYRAVLDPTKPARLPAALSRFEAPATVRVAASRPATGQELTLHFVNYNRQEPAAKRSPGTGIQDEKPLAAQGVAVDLELPPGANVSRVLVSSPESPDASASSASLLR